MTTTVVTKFCFFITIVVISPKSKAAVRRNCTIENPLHLKAHIGWPFTVLCNSLVEKTYPSFKCSEGKSLNVSCKIFNTDEEVFTQNEDLAAYCFNKKVGYPLPDYNYTEYKITVEVNNTRCFSMMLIIELEKLREISCENYFQSHGSDYSSSVDIGERKALNCEAKEKPKIYDKDNVTYGWQRNCSELPGNAVVENNVLKIDSVTFEDAGFYSCFAIYNGMIRYTTFHHICVKRQTAPNESPTLECSNKEKHVKTGNSAIFECLGFFGEGTISDEKVYLKWKKISESGESNEASVPCSRESSEKVFCTFKTESGKCYLHNATEEERSLQNATVKILFKINNVTESDYGSYVIIFSHQSNSGKSHNTTLTLKAPINFIAPLIIGGCIAGVMFIVIASIMLVLNKAYMEVYFKRLCGKYETDEKKYGACLLYHFSQNLDKFAKENIASTVHTCRTLLEKMGFEVYDKYKDGFTCDEQAEDIKYSMMESHRLIIFLTEDFIKDDWSVYGLHNGFDKMIQTGSKIIFVLIPGVIAYLKQNASKDETCGVIVRALKINYSFEYKKKMSSHLLKMELENSMPKLNRKKSSKTTDFVLVNTKALELYGNISQI